MSYTKLYKVCIIRTIPDFVEEGYDVDDRERTFKAFCIVSSGNKRGALHKAMLHISGDVSPITSGLPHDIKFEKVDNSQTTFWDATYKNDEYELTISIKQLNPGSDYNFSCYELL